MKIEPIETPRLTLRGFTKDDALWAYSIWNNPEMGEYLPDEAKEEADVEYIKDLETIGEDETCCYLIPVLKDSHERIGTCSFIPSEDGKSYDIAYCVHKKYWCNGYATEMAEGMINYARAHGAAKITVRVNKENTASNAVVRKIDFKVVGEKSYKKRGTELAYTDYLYELDL